MRQSSVVVLLVVGAGLVVAQTPAVTSVVNSASNLPAGLPNAGIAQGALMTIFGSNLGPGNIILTPGYPLTAALAGTSVRITMGSKNVDALMYYTLVSQVAAIVPSTTPTGTGTVTVTYNGKTSAAFPITIVQNNAGLYTVNSAGSGTAVATFGDYSYVTPSNAANPGEYLVLWANGLGPVSTDDAQQPVSADMTNVPVEVFIGGKPAPVLFRGRNSCCSSLDQINIQVPDGVAGCVTPLVVKIGSMVSNTATIPLAASGRNCKTNSGAITDGLFQSFNGKTQPTVGQVAMLRSRIRMPGTGNTISTTTGDAGSAFFYKATPAYPFALAQNVDLQPAGSCLISISASGAPAAYTTTSLDAGPQITITGPNGTRTYPRNTSLTYLGTLGAGVDGNYLDAGNYTVSGAGGPNVGAFQTSVNFPKTLVWTNQDTTMTVSRAAGVTVNWTGGDPAGTVQISGQTTAQTSPTTTVAARFDCAAKVSDGSFTIPPAVLLSLPPTGTKLGTLTVGDTYARAPFQASGLDFGFIYFGSSGLNLDIVTYQ